MKNFEKCIYTYRHRAALKYTICQVLAHDPELRQMLLKRAEVHDMDKMVLYLIWNKEDASQYHKKTAPHHIANDLPHSRLDCLEAVFDYECSGYTKPDKPRNAFDCVKMLRETGVIGEDMYERMMALIRELGLDRSYRVNELDPVGAEKLSKMPVTEQDILDSVTDYLKHLN